MKRYIEEPGSQWVGELLDRERPATAELSQIEITSALARRCREGAFDEPERDRAIRRLDRDFRTLLSVRQNPEVLERSQRLLCQYPLRTGDAVQLASCLVLAEHLHFEVPFVAFDRRLREIAQAAGLTVSPADPASVA